MQGGFSINFISDKAPESAGYLFSESREGGGGKGAGVGEAFSAPASHIGVEVAHCHAVLLHDLHRNAVVCVKLLI